MVRLADFSVGAVLDGDSRAPVVVGGGQQRVLPANRLKTVKIVQVPK